jgi:hypothetical protein
VSPPPPRVGGFARLERAFLFVGLALVGENSRRPASHKKYSS